MHAPELIDCPSGVWTLIASGVTEGLVHLKDAGPGGYLQTYRPTNEDPPTEQSEGVKIEETTIPIKCSFEIDVYIMALGADGVVRYDE